MLANVVDTLRLIHTGIQTFFECTVIIWGFLLVSGLFVF